MQNFSLQLGLKVLNYLGSLCCLPCGANHAYTLLRVKFKVE